MIDILITPGLDRAILHSILSYHVGRENAISRGQMLKDLARLGFPVDDRQMRACINALRKGGQLICSRGGYEGGYWLAANWEDYQEYEAHELTPRIADLAEQRTAMRRTAEAEWGARSLQIGLGV